MTAASGDAYERILDKLDGVKRTGDKATAFCPAHEDRKKQSLSIRRFPQRIRLKCFAGCDDQAVLDAVGLTIADLFDDPRGAQWSYPDGWQVFRAPDKTIRQKGPKVNGQRTTALYRADTLGRAKADGRTVYLVEGEPDAEAICSLGEVATTSRMGASNFQHADVSPLYGADIVAIPDQDEAGEAWVRAVKTELADKAKSLTFRKPKLGKDVSDHLTAGLELADLEPYEVKPSPLLAGLRTGDWLDQQQFDPLQWVVPNLFPEGFSLLVGAPKIGKSWMSLSIAIAVASGGYVFGRLRVEKRPVLLLALEDSDRRLQDRIRKLIGPGEKIPPLLSYLTRVEPNQVLVTIREWLSTLPAKAKPLIILDTLGKVMPPALAGETTYQRDYKVSGALKRIADDRPGTSVIGLHHDRKSATEDFVEAVSGTHGIAGAADTVAVIKRQRQQNGSALHVTGRDVREGEYQLEIAGGTTWKLVGESLLTAARAAHEEAVVEGLGDRSGELVRFVGSFPNGVKLSTVAKELGMTQEDAGKYLSRLVYSGRLTRPNRGLYARARTYIPPGESGESGEFVENYPDSPGVRTRAGAREDISCSICGHLLHPSLVEAGETTHPNC
jgi:hypothetical protein